METTCKRIRALRKEANLNQAQLAKACGVSGQIISNVERACSRPSTELVNRLSEFFNVPADYILGLTNCRWFPDSPYYSKDGIPGRIANRLDQLQMDRQKFIRMTKIDDKSYQAIMDGSTKPTTDVLIRMAKSLDTTVDYLIGSTDISIAIADEDEQDILIAYRKLSKKGKRIFMGLLEQM